MKNVILEKLKEIEEIEDVKIIFAVESGSRAWGFESSDSDYDVRFVYVRKQQDYLRLDPVRDVIEWQLDETLDINGWDLQKALRLAYKGNPVFFEWMHSPVFYYADEVIFPKLKEVTASYFSSKKGMYHYWHMSSKNMQEYLQRDQVKIKKYFYALRPIWAADWIDAYQSVPPVAFAELKEDFCPPDIAIIVEKLLTRKMKSNETEIIAPIPELNQYLEKELARLEKRALQLEESHRSWHSLNQFFRTLIL